MGKIRVVVADDHDMVREGVVSLLNNDESNEIEVVADFSDPQEAINYISKPKNEVDIALLDYSFGEGKINGAEAAMRIKEKKPGVKVALLTTYDSTYLDPEALRSIDAFVAKRVPSEQIIDCIKQVHQEVR